MKIAVGNTFPNYTVDTVYNREVSLKDILGENKTALIFLRYEGCTLCRYEMMLMKNEYDKIIEVGGKILVVLQSDPDRLNKELEKDCYPFEIICDPSQKLYAELEIKVAKAKEEMIGPGSMEKLKKVQESGLVHGEYEGEEMQLPAAFIVDKDMTVSYAHYATNITDMPIVEEIISLLQ